MAVQPGALGLGTQTGPMGKNIGFFGLRRPGKTLRGGIFSLSALKPLLEVRNKSISCCKQPFTKLIVVPGFRRMENMPINVMYSDCILSSLVSSRKKLKMWLSGSS